MFVEISIPFELTKLDMLFGIIGSKLQWKHKTLKRCIFPFVWKNNTVLPGNCMHLKKLLCPVVWIWNRFAVSLCFRCRFLKKLKSLISLVGKQHGKIERWFMPYTRKRVGSLEKVLLHEVKKHSIPCIDDVTKIHLRFSCKLNEVFCFP